LGNPSLRYLTLLREGARAHELPEHWIRYLESVEHEPVCARAILLVR